MEGFGVVVVRAPTRQRELLMVNSSQRFSRPNITAPTKYVYEQLTGLIGGALLNGQAYFDIHPKLVRKAMDGRFPNSVIIVMGCTGFITSEMAQALRGQGAGVYISWDTSVIPARTDAAT